MTPSFSLAARLSALSLALLSSLSFSVSAQDKASPGGGADKTPFHLFNPTPTPLMREMSTDRPDTTESPYTVDAGHFQVEMSFFDYQQFFDSGLRGEAWSICQMNLKAGLWHNTDLQVLFNLHDSIRITGGLATTTASGFADVTVRLKTNIWGNEGGRTALAVMPYVTAPTGGPVGSDDWAGGLIVPLSIELTDRLSLSLMAQVDLVPDVAASGYDLALVHSASLGISVTENLGVYTELVGIAGNDDQNYQALFNTGVTFSVTDNLVFDAGIRVGLNNDTPDFGAFTGVSIRF